MPDHGMHARWGELPDPHENLKPLILIIINTGCAARKPNFNDTEVKYGKLTLPGILEETLRYNKMPAVTAAIVCNGESQCYAAGVRKVGVESAIELTDKFHIGSCAKTMTAHVIRELIQEGRMKWDTKIIDIFPEIKASESSQEITVFDLLTHRSGLKANVSDYNAAWWINLWSVPDELASEERVKLTAMILSQETLSKPGTKEYYSNVGYMIAGAMAERLLRQPWDVIVRSRVFSPTGMKNAGFGPPALNEVNISQPWGHKGLRPIEPSALSDNPFVISPAGTIHCSIKDMAAYLDFIISQTSVYWDIDPKIIQNDFQDQWNAPGWVYIPFREWAHGQCYSVNFFRFRLVL